VSSRPAETARDLTIEVMITLTNLCDATPIVRSFASLRMTRVKNMKLEFVSAMRAENEFELQKDRVDLAIGKEEVLLQEIVIVLESDL
jgi:hypothetical protein